MREELPSQNEGAPEIVILPYLAHAALSDVGRKREENQDSYGIIEQDGIKIFVVADGMGGVKGGAIASRLAIDVFERSLTGEHSAEVYVDAVKTANLSVFEKGQADIDYTGMGTTFLALCFSGCELYVLHVGDSRAYRFREGRVSQLTHDHTLIQELVDSGALTEEQAVDHPVSHMLTRSLGPTRDVAPDCVLLLDGPAAEDRYLICSDGLYNLVEPDEMGAILEGKSDTDAAKALVDLANERGGTDNITVLIVSVDSDYPVKTAHFRDAHNNISNEDTVELHRSETVGIVQDQGNGTDTGESAESASPLLSSRIALEEGAAKLEEQRLQSEGDISSGDDQPQEISSQPHRALHRLPVLPAIVGVGAGMVLMLVIVSSGIFQEATPASSSSTSEMSMTSEIRDQSELGPTQETIIHAVENAVENPEELGNELEKTEGGLHPDLASIGVEQRKELLEVRRERLSKRLELLEAPLSGGVGEILRLRPRERKEREKELQAVRAEIDIATRRLSVWYGRKRRLENSDPLHLSIEVAAVSDDVGDAKKAFDSVTWEYLKLSESYRYDPANLSLKEEMGKLREQRQEQLTLLIKAIQDAIQREISQSDEEISRLTLKRDRIEDELKELSKDQNIAKLVAQGNKEERENMGKQLRSELDLIERELEELSGILH